jgi:hypothetical protein
MGRDDCDHDPELFRSVLDRPASRRLRGHGTRPTLTEPVRALANWASDNQDAILGHRNAFDETRKQQADGVPVAA